MGRRQAPRPSFSFSPSVSRRTPGLRSSRWRPSPRKDHRGTASCWKWERTGRRFPGERSSCASTPAGGRETRFVVLNWGDAGWVPFFAREAFTHPSEMKAMKLYIGAGDVPLTQLYKEAGFKPVPISVVDILPGLQTGLIDAFNATPLAALAFQWFALAPNIADPRWGLSPSREGGGANMGREPPPGDRGEDHPRRRLRRSAEIPGRVPGDPRRGKGLRALTAAGEAMGAPAGSGPGGGAGSFPDKFENAIS